MSLKKHIDELQQQFTDSLKNVSTEQELENVRIEYLSRNGKIPALMGQLKSLPLEEKKVFGPKLNQFKKASEDAFNNKKEKLFSSTISAAQEKNAHFDVTAYEKDPVAGSLHVYTHITEQLERIFMSMGYSVIDGPEVETDYYNFETLNIPGDHPARDMHDTFWLNVPNLLLRTHTSSVQAHAMEKQQPPLAVFAPGRVFRNEATDASHNFMFPQGEALFVDKNVSMANLLATTKTFLQEIFEKKDLQIRVRPGFFPFVEPGVEVDAQCPFCTKGCSVCKKTRWIELLGAGLVHPNVLRCNGIDPEVYSGFAFGFGLGRLAMIKYGINDIRLFHSNKMSFLKQF